MLGNLHFRTAFSWKGNGVSSNILWKKAVRLLEPAWGVILHPDLESRKYAESYFSLESDSLLISAFCFDETIGKKIIRIFNPTETEGSGRLCGEKVPAAIRKISYDRGSAVETDAVIPVGNLRLQAGEIATFCID